MRGNLPLVLRTTGEFPHIMRFSLTSCCISGTWCEGKFPQWCTEKKTIIWQACNPSLLYSNKLLAIYTTESCFLPFTFLLYTALLMSNVQATPKHCIFNNILSVLLIYLGPFHMGKVAGLQYEVPQCHHDATMSIRHGCGAALFTSMGPIGRQYHLLNATCPTFFPTRQCKVL